MPGTRGLRAQQSPPENLTGLGERERRVSQLSHVNLAAHPGHQVKFLVSPLSMKLFTLCCCKSDASANQKEPRCSTQHFANWFVNSSLNVRDTFLGHSDRRCSFALKK